MSPILKIRGNDEKKEREFTLRCNLMLSVDERIYKMLEVSKRIQIIAKKYAARKTYRIIQRS